MRNNIILIGYMGCGKSTIGRALSQRSEKMFLDTDAWIEKREDKKISQIFIDEGELYFRDLETNCLKELLKEQSQAAEHEGAHKNKSKDFRKTEQKEYVISVGGGLPVREENQSLLKLLGKVIYLKADADTIYERIKGDTSRPLLQTPNPREKIKEMMLNREEKYQATAQHVILVDGKSVDSIVNEILLLQNEKTK